MIKITAHYQTETYYRYWVTFVRAADGKTCGEEMCFEYELTSGEAIRRAETAYRFSNGDTEQDAINILNWKRLD